MASVVLKTHFTSSWFVKGGPHHVSLPKRDVQAWMHENGLLSPGENSCRIKIFAEGNRVSSGKLNYDTGFLSGVSSLFQRLGIHPDFTDLSLWVRLSFESSTPEIDVFRVTPPQEHQEIRWDEAPLHPFSAKSENPYQVQLKAELKERSKPHEHLLNRFCWFLEGLGYSPKNSKTIDLALESPPLIVEAKAVADERSWRDNVRAAVAQLHEYRWLYMREAKLLFLASEAVPEEWREYLMQCHRIFAAWPVGDGFFVEDMDELFPVAVSRKKQCVFLNEPLSEGDEE